MRLDEAPDAYAHSTPESTDGPKVVPKIAA